MTIEPKNFQELVLIRGLPGSGKTTLAKMLVLHGYKHFEADQFFEVDGEYRFDPSQLPWAHLWCQWATAFVLRNGKSVVVSNTFTRLWEMDTYFKLAEASRVHIRVIEATGSWPNIHNVPEESIQKMRDRWEPYAGCSLD